VDDSARHEWVAAHILPHEGEVRAWLRRRVYRLTSADIDDLIQDAYARLCSVRLETIGNGRSYLFTVVRNLLVEQARRARIVPMERLGEIDALRIPSEEPGPDRRVGAQLELERLEHIIASLPDQCRRAFRLQKFHSFSQREIALEMNIAEKTVEKHLASALVRILDALKEDPCSEEPRLDAGSSGHDAEHTKD
jgi:RNA polymerase sigma factor (sigma-70 family)